MNSRSLRVEMHGLEEDDTDPYNYYIAEAQKVTTYDSAIWKQVGLMDTIESTKTKPGEQSRQVSVRRQENKPVRASDNPFIKRKKLTRERDEVLGEILYLVREDEPDPESKEGIRLAKLRIDLDRIDTCNPFVDYRNYKRKKVMRSLVDNMREKRNLDMKDDKAKRRDTLKRQQEKLKDEIRRIDRIARKEALIKTCQNRKR